MKSHIGDRLPFVQKPLDIRRLLQQLEGTTAAALESETLEFKRWDADSKSMRRKVRESVVALANQSGGYLVLGVEDKVPGRAAISGVPDIDLGDLVRRIHDGTDPGIIVEAEELDEPEGRVVALRVPRGIPPHTTREGVAKIRIGTESKPLTGHSLAELMNRARKHDLTAEPPAGAGAGDLDPAEIERMRSALARRETTRHIAAMSDGDLLRELELARDGIPTRAAVLLLGTRAALRRTMPDHEVIVSRRASRTDYDYRENLRLPLLALLEEMQRFIEANISLTVIQPPGFQELEIPNLSWRTAREGLLNALAHRDYFPSQSIHVDLLPDRLEITSPGGFIDGVTPENVLWHPSARRNPLLAEALEKIGLVNRSGFGVKRIYEETLADGKDLPQYEAGLSFVKLTLPTAINPAFARLARGARQAGEPLAIEELILLRGIARNGALTRRSAAELLPLSEEQTAERLPALRERGFLDASGRGRGTAYRFAARFAELNPERGGGARDGSRGAARRLVLEALRERGRLTNAEIRALTGLSRAQVLRLMGELRREGAAEVRGRRRGAHYVAAEGGGTAANAARK